MAVGNESFWVIVDLQEKEAVQYPDDRRRSIRWMTEEAALRYCEQFPVSRRQWVVVKILG